MKVAIITLHRVYNYGSVLQAYATQTVFERAGYEVEVIDYITEQRTKKKIMKTDAAGSNKGMSGAAYKFFKMFSVLLKEMTFGKFVEKNLHLTKQYITADDLEQDPPRADIYVTGSDQTWNSQYNGGGWTAVSSCPSPPKIKQKFLLLPVSENRILMIWKWPQQSLLSQSTKSYQSGRTLRLMSCINWAGMMEPNSLIQLYK